VQRPEGFGSGRGLSFNRGVSVATASSDFFFGSCAAGFATCFRPFLTASKSTVSFTATGFH